jgi:hypothetical protein
VLDGPRLAHVRLHAAHVTRPQFSGCFCRSARWFNSKMLRWWDNCLRRPRPGGPLRVTPPALVLGWRPWVPLHSLRRKSHSWLRPFLHNIHGIGLELLQNPAVCSCVPGAPEARRIIWNACDEN